MVKSQTYPYMCVETNKSADRCINVPKMFSKFPGEASSSETLEAMSPYDSDDKVDRGKLDPISRLRLAYVCQKDVTDVQAL